MGCGHRRCWPTRRRSRARQADSASNDGRGPHRRPHSSQSHRPGSHATLHDAVVFFVIALVAATYGGIGASAVGLGQILFIVFTALAVAGSLVGLSQRA